MNIPFPAPFLFLIYIYIQKREHSFPHLSYLFFCYPYILFYYILYIYRNKLSRNFLPLSHSFIILLIYRMIYTLPAPVFSPQIK